MTAPTTRERLLDAAMQLVAEDGLQAVTHRAVEERAGVARGSTRYHFATRDLLLAALVEHAAGQATGFIEQAGALTGASTVPGVSEAELRAAGLAQLAAIFLADPTVALPQFELYLHAARHPELAPVMHRWRASFIEFGAAHLAAVGAPEPEAGSRLMAATLDGLVLHALSSPHPDYQRWGPQWFATLAAVATTLGAQPGDSPQVHPQA